jgi:hypothetical protein
VPLNARADAKKRLPVRHAADFRVWGVERPVEDLALAKEDAIASDFGSVEAV